MNNVPKIRYLDCSVVEVCLVGNVHFLHRIWQHRSGLMLELSILWALFTPYSSFQSIYSDSGAERPVLLIAYHFPCV
jgi:hypothetical protein